MIKNTNFTQKTLDYKYVTDLTDCKKISVVLKNKQVLDETGKLTHNENGQKMPLQCKQRHCATHCKPETKKRRDSSNACVCLYRLLKLLTDDHSDLVTVKLKNEYMPLCNLQYNLA